MNQVALFITLQIILILLVFILLLMVVYKYRMQVRSIKEKRGRNIFNE